MKEIMTGQKTILTNNVAQSKTVTWRCASTLARKSHCCTPAKASSVPATITNEEPTQMMILSNCFPNLLHFCKPQISGFSGVREYMNLVQHTLGDICTGA